MKYVGHILLNSLVLAEKFIAIFKKPNCLITSDNFVQMKSLLKDGDIVCSRTDWEISNLFIGKPYDHCGIYIQGKVTDATTEGVKSVLVEEWMFKKDHVGILRSIEPVQNLQAGIDFLAKCIGDKYNFDFFAMSSTKKMFCSEMAWKFLCAVTAPGYSTRVPLVKHLGILTISPSDLWNKTSAFNRIGEFQ